MVLKLQRALDSLGGPVKCRCWLHPRHLWLKVPAGAEELAFPTQVILPVLGYTESHWRGQHYECWAGAGLETAQES